MAVEVHLNVLKLRYYVEVICDLHAPSALTAWQRHSDPSDRKLVRLESRSGCSRKEESFLPPIVIEPAISDRSVRNLVTILYEACGSRMVSWGITSSNFWLLVLIFSRFSLVLAAIPRLVKVKLLWPVSSTVFLLVKDTQAHLTIASSLIKPRIRREKFLSFSCKMT